MQPMLSAPQPRRPAGPRSPAARLLLQNADTYYTGYHVAAQAPPPRSNTVLPMDHTALTHRPDKSSSLTVVGDSSSPPFVGTHSSSGLRHLSHPLQFPTVWPESHPDSYNFGRMSHRVLTAEPRHNFASLITPSNGNSQVDMPYNVDNKFHPACLLGPTYNEPLPSFAQVEAEINRYMRDHDTILPSISDDQGGFLEESSMRSSGEDAAARNTREHFSPYKDNRQPPSVLASLLPSLQGSRLIQKGLSVTQNSTHDQHFASRLSTDNGNAPPPESNRFVQPKSCQNLPDRVSMEDSMRSSPHRVPSNHNLDMEIVTDEHILSILVSNQTIAKQFRSACAVHLQQCKRSLDKAYDQRLSEIEDYTRKWRDHTRELWQAVKAGQFMPVDVSQQAALAWQGPQEMARGSKSQLPFIDTHSGEPVFNRGSQTIKGDASSEVSASAAQSVAPPAPQSPPHTRLLQAQPGHCRLHQDGSRLPIDSILESAKPVQSTGLLSNPQIVPSLPVLPNRPPLGRATSIHPTYRRSGALQTAPSQSILSQPGTSNLSVPCLTDSTNNAAFTQSLPRQSGPGQRNQGEPDLSQTTPVPAVALQAPERRLSCREWIVDFEGCVRDASGKYTSKSHRLLTLLSSGNLGRRFSSSLEISYSAILLSVKTDSSGYEYRRFDHLSMTRSHAFPSDVVVDLSEVNIIILGKAFCYMKERRSLLRSELGLTLGRQLGVEGQMQRMYNFFSQQPTNKTLHTMRHPESNRTGVSSRDPVHEARNLLIARPKHQDGHVTGAAYFDVGSEQPVTRTGRGMCLWSRGPLNLGYVTDLISDNSVVFEEDSVLFGRLMALLNLCLELHIIVLAGAAPSTSKEDANTNDLQAQFRGSEGGLVSLDSQVRWDKWVKVVQGTTDGYLRMAVENTKRSFDMGFYKYPLMPEIAHGLNTPTKQKIWFKSTIVKGVVQCFDLKSSSLVLNPVISGQDIVIQWTASNVLVFWKAFCLLKERTDRLLTLHAQKTGMSPGIVAPTSHERLARYYRDFLATKDRQTKLYSISLPIASWDGDGNPIFDVTSRGWFVDMRLILGRIHSKDSAVDKATIYFFDVGTVAPIEGKPNSPGGEYNPQRIKKTCMTQKPGVYLFEVLANNLLSQTSSLLNTAPSPRASLLCS